MNIKQIKETLPHLLRHKIVPFLWGAQGVGKTQTVSQYAASNDLELVVLHTATQEVGDLIGLLMRDGDTVRHARPDWFPTSGKGIIFLDELNRAPQDVLQALFSFILSGTLHQHKLPPEWHVVAAGNYMSDKFTVTNTTDAAWLSRFCHLDFQPSTEEWVLYADSKGAESVADFIREQPSMLGGDGKLDTSFITPDRRAWLDGVGKLEAEGLLPDELRYEIYSGLVGSAASAAFISQQKKAQKGIKLKDVLGKYDKIRESILRMNNAKESRFDLLNGVIDELVANLGSNQDLLKAGNKLANLQQFLLDVPRELSTKTFMMMRMMQFFGREELLNDINYVQKFY